MAEIQRLEAVIKALERKAAEARDVSVVVGFTAAYSIFVHENLEAHHPVGQAKFLEQPLRENGRHYRQVIVQAARGGASWEQAMVMGGLSLQRDAQELCPVDTGNMRASAFTRVEE